MPVKTAASFRPLFAVAAFLFATLAFAQTASLKSDTTGLAPDGGTVALTATVSYDAQPGAIGWSIALPADWTLVSVAGANVPEIAPDPGTGGVLEFAYTNVPAGRAEFSLVVRYPAGTTAAKAAPTVLVRSAGKLTTLTPAAVEFGPK